MGAAITVFSTVWCGHCRRLKRELEGAGIPYEEVDVDVERHHGDRIVALTGGFRIVPTVEIGGAMLVNPSLAQVQEALARL